MSRYIPVFQQFAPTAPKIFDLEEMCERSGILTLHLIREQKYRLHVSYLDHLTFRKADEGDALETLDAIDATSQLGRSFYVVEDSEYVQWFVDQGHGIRHTEKLIHTTILTSTLATIRHSRPLHAACEAGVVGLLSSAHRLARFVNSSTARDARVRVPAYRRTWGVAWRTTPRCGSARCLVGCVAASQAA